MKATYAPARNIRSGPAVWAPSGIPEERHHAHAKTPAEWIDDINRTFGKGITRTLRFAATVAAARSSLHKKGEWTQLCKSGRVPFRLRAAQMLIVIGLRLAGVDVQASARLPCGWNTLYYLALLPREVLLQLVEGERIHPKLTLNEAKELLADFKGLGLKSHRNPNVRQRIRKFSDFVQSTLNEWSAPQRELALAELAKLQDQIEASANGCLPGNNPLPTVSPISLLTFPGSPIPSITLK